MRGKEGQRYLSDAGEGIGYPLQYLGASLVAQLLKNPPAMWETWVWSLGWEDPLEKGKATHSSILAWRIPWTIVYGVARSRTERLSLHLWHAAAGLLQSHPSSIHQCAPSTRFCAWLGSPSGVKQQGLYLPEYKRACSVGVQSIFTFSGDEQSVRPPGGLLPEHLSRAQTLLGKGNWQTDLLSRIRRTSPGKKCTQKVRALSTFLLLIFKNKLWFLGWF